MFETILILLVVRKKGKLFPALSFKFKWDRCDTHHCVLHNLSLEKTVSSCRGSWNSVLFILFKKKVHGELELPAHAYVPSLVHHPRLGQKGKEILGVFFLELSERRNHPPIPTTRENERLVPRKTRKQIICFFEC